jgi:hypothetical protein
MSLSETNPPERSSADGPRALDGGVPVDGYTRRDENCSPQRTVLIPADNILDDGTPWSFTHRVIVVPKHAAHV